MLRRLAQRLSYANVMSTIAVFGVLAGGTAYAANTISSADIIDGQVKGADVGNGEILSADVKDESLTTFDVSTFLGVDVVDGTLTGDDIGDGTLTGFDIKDGFIGQGELADGAVNSAKTANNSLTGTDIQDGSLTGFDIQDGFIGQGELADGAVNSAKTADNSLTGTDINESTLNLPPTTTVTFMTVGQTSMGSDAFAKVASKSLPAGSYAVTATANTETQGLINNTAVTDVSCELRNGNGVIGGTRDRRERPAGQFVRRSLTMNGGAQVPAGGGEVSLWCNAQSGAEFVADAQMMFIRTDGFF